MLYHRPVLEHSRDPKFYDQGCLKMCVLPSLFPVMIPVTGRSAHLSQEVSSIKKLPVRKVKSFLKLNSELHQKNVK